MVGIGLAGLLVYGFIRWKSSGAPFPTDLRGSTEAVAARGTLRAGDLGGDADTLGRAAVQRLAHGLEVPVLWVDLPASDLLRLLHADSLDVISHYDASLNGSEAFGLTHPYRVSGDARYVLAVPAGENRLLRLADGAVRTAAGR